MPMAITGSKHVPPDRVLVPELVDELCDYVNDSWGDRSPIHLASYCMWRLNWIHPFVDGNGRTSRALSYLILCAKLGYELPGRSTIPDQISENKQSYYQALEEADRHFEKGKVDLGAMEMLLERLLESQLSGVRSEAIHPPMATASLTVERITLRNFRCFEELIVDLQPGSRLGGRWTCLAGVNGSGKTAVLEAISLVLLGAELAVDLGSGRLKRLRRRVRGVRYESRILATVMEGGEERVLEMELQEGLIAPSIRAGAGGSAGSFWSRQKQRVLLSFGATRNLSGAARNTAGTVDEEVLRQLSLFEPHSQLAHAPTMFGRLEGSGLFMELLKSLIDSVFPGELGVVEREGRVWFEMVGNLIAPEDLPDGYRSSVAWLADLCATWVLKSPPGGQDADPARIDAVVLIDEIDLHLHPSLQRRIVPRLRKALPRVQWIVTTHSPMVVSSFSSDEIVVLDRERKGGTWRPDREIFGFSTDEVYEWLMDTPPRSLVIDELAKRALQTDDEQAAEDVSLLLSLSPEVGNETARKLLERRKELGRQIAAKRSGEPDS